MAMNKFMHPRNIYKTPPDFAKLAREFPEFSRISKVDVAGKIIVDFKDPQSLRILTKCLLLSDFNLDVDIPEDKLVPTLPLRLNYILWLEDLLHSIQRNSNVRGLDIGTGACAIYPLLAAKKNQWHMVGTETDAASFLKAQENVQKNKLGSLIQLKKNVTSSIIAYLLIDKASHTFDFCMCNPPFYSSIQELCESRSPARPPPKNGFTGSPHELITEGGELEFCRKILKESRDYKDNIRIFTTMVGHKYNLAELIQDLKAEGITYTHTEFCQGRVTRWGLAWTYQNYDIHKLVPSRNKLRKHNLPLTYLLPELPKYTNNVQSAFDKIKIIFDTLNIIYKVIDKRNNNICIDITAKTNTWSNQRRRKRMLKRIETENVKKTKLDTFEEIDRLSSKYNQNTENNLHPSDCNKNSDTSTHLINGSNNSQTTEHHEDIRNVVETVPVIHAILKVIKKENDVLLQMEFIDGVAGKEGLHQIIQYIKNNWK